jgi:hypothetical protein
MTKPKSFSRDFFVESGRKGGKAKTPKKAAAVKANGKLGGRPKKDQK